MAFSFKNFSKTNLTTIFLLLFLKFARNFGFVCLRCQGNNPFSDLGYFDIEESIDPRSEIRFCDFPKKTNPKCRVVLALKHQLGTL